MPKILRILNRFSLGGPVLNAAYLTRYLPADYQTLLVGGPKEKDEADATDVVRGMGIESVHVSEMRRAIDPVKDIPAYRRICQIIDDFKPDIVHTHASKAGTIGRLAAVAKGVNVIVHTFHGHVFDGYFNPAKTQIFIKIERQLARRTSCIIALSHKQKQDLSETYAIAPPEKIIVIPLGLDFSPFRVDTIDKRRAFRAQFNIDEEEIAIGMIGRLAPVKNHALFLDAIKQVNEHASKKIRAFIIGDGEFKKRLIRRCQDLRLSWSVAGNEQAQKPTVTFTSWIKPIDTAYPGLDVVAMTSLNEGTPVSLIEAQACGIPIVSANVGGIEDIVLPDRTALTFKNNDVVELTEKLLKMVEEKEIRERLAQNGWNHVKNRFHYTRLVSDMEKVYASLLQKR